MDSNKANPMEMREILAIFFSKIEKVEVLKTARLVSKLWRDESFEFWRKRAVLRITRKTKRLLIKAFKHRGTEEHDPFHLFSTPFAKFRFSEDISSHWPFLVPSAYEEAFFFWENCLSQAEYLDVGNCLIRWRGGYVEGLKWVLMKCPLLKELKIAPYNEISPSNSEDEEKDSDEEEIKRQFVSVNLQTLTISQSGSTYHFHGDEDDTLKFREIDDESHWIATKLISMLPNLKNLRLHPGMNPNSIMAALQTTKSTLTGELLKLHGLSLLSTDSHLDKLEKYLELAKPPLNDLELAVNLTECFSSKLNKVLNLCQNKLIRLKLQINCDCASLTVPCQSFCLNINGNFPNLTVLELNLTENALISFELQSLWNMPSLKSFHLGFITKTANCTVGMCFKNERGNERSSHFQLDKLNKLHFHGKLGEYLTLLGNMQNLTTLEVVVEDNNSFLNILKQFPKLNLIKLLPGSNLNVEYLNVMEACRKEITVDKSLL